MAREQGAKVLAIVNTHGSTIPRESDAVLYTHAGPEIAVASTKAFLAQITAAYLLGLYLAQLRGNKFADEVTEILDELRAMPDKIQQVLDRAGRIVGLVARFPTAPRLVAGVAPPTSYALVPARAVAAFLAENAVSAGAETAAKLDSLGAVAATLSAAIVAIECPR